MANILKQVKMYPHTVRLKKVWIGIAGMSLLSVAIVILYNLHYATTLPQKIQKLTQANAPLTVAHDQDTDWYRHYLNQPVTSMMMPISTPVATTTPSSTTPVANPSSSTETSKVTKTPPLNQPLQKNPLILDAEGLKAMSTPINSNQMVSEPTLTQTPVETLSKIKTTVKKPESPYVLQAGTLIPGSLITGINADLPGQIMGQVRSHVYDSLTGRYLLIPQGSKLVGVYDAKTVYGQERVLVAWQRLLLPNGQQVDLPQMAGVDNSGYAGLTDKVNAHYTQRLGSAVLMSVLGAGVLWSQPPIDPNSSSEPLMRQALSQNATANVMNNTASALMQKDFDRKPTLEIRPGYTFNVSVNEDIVFPQAYAITEEVD